LRLGRTGIDVEYAAQLRCQLIAVVGFAEQLRSGIKPTLMNDRISPFTTSLGSVTAM